MPTHIAVVNDDSAFLFLMRELLTDEGYTVTLLRETEGAYERLREILPDMIILDMRMEHPDSGWMVLETIKLDPKMTATPVILCSADTREIEQRAEDLHRKGCEILAKPFDMNDLLRMVRRLLSNEDSPARS